MRRVILMAGVFLVCCALQANACVGKVLTIGVLNSSEGQVLGEMLSTIITERTGTTVKIRMYATMQEVYEAVKTKQVDISVENTLRALKILNRPAEPDAKKALEIARASYEKELGMVWLKPFGFTNGNGAGGPSYTATVLRAEVLNNFPVLPRVIDKLASMINDDSYARLVRSVESGEKPKKVARDFLKSKKLI